MAKTYTEQASVPSANINADGDGMHGMIPFDMIRGLNNLGTYVNPHAHYVQGAAIDSTTGVTGSVIVSYTAAGRECFMLEIPLLVPFWAFRLAYVIGARCNAATMSTLTVYLSRTPYIGPDGNTGAFNAAGMSTGYRSRAINMFGLGGGAYEQVDDSSPGITPIDGTVYQQIDTNTESHTKGLAYVIVTTTGAANAQLEIDDCTFWFLPT